MLFLLCYYDGNCCALQASCINEILPLAKLRPAGSASGVLRGILDYRGKPLEVYDLGLLNGANGCRELISTRIIIINHQGSQAGLLAEEVYDMVEIKIDGESNVSNAEDGWLRRGGELISRFDPARLFVRKASDENSD